MAVHREEIYERIKTEEQESTYCIGVYLRSLLVHGARSVVIRAANKDDRLSRWINKVKAERGFNKAVVALANKMARIGWAVLVNNTTYQIA